MKTACNCGWTTDPKRATRLHDEDCPTMKTFRDERASVTGGILTLISENGALLAENERLRALLEKIADDGPEFGKLTQEIHAALAGGRGEK